MGANLEEYILKSIERFRIKRVGYDTHSRMPFVILENDLIFYGLPSKRKKILEDILYSIVEVVKDLEYRYFQSNRKLKQHSRYHYREGDVVVEIGSYLGYYSMYAAMKVGHSGRVLSVELIPENYEVLRLNLSSNYPGNTIAINRGVHNEKGLRPAYLGRNQIAGFRKDVITQYTTQVREINVAMDTVDNILQENDVDEIDLMIIQINGNEIDALDGMPKSIRRVSNFAIAAPYNSKGVDHKTFLGDYLHKYGFNVDIDPPWVYASRKRSIPTTTD